jgi:hypothetical protein
MKLKPRAPERQAARLGTSGKGHVAQRCVPPVTAAAPRGARADIKRGIELPREPRALGAIIDFMQALDEEAWFIMARDASRRKRRWPAAAARDRRASRREFAEVIPTQLRRLPRSAVAPGLDVDDGDKRVRRARSVLVLAELPATARARMKDRGAQLTDVENVAAAVAMLAEREFDAAIVDMKAPGGGTALVKCLKGGVGSTDPLQKHLDEAMAAIAAAPKDPRGAPSPGQLEVEVAEIFETTLGDLKQFVEAAQAAPVSPIVAMESKARRRHRLTPFYLVMEGEQHYAIVIDPPEHSYLEDGKGISLADAVMCLDVGKLLLRGPALA